jgi:hypothetical protein
MYDVYLCMFVVFRSYAYRTHVETVYSGTDNTFPALLYDKNFLESTRIVNKLVSLFVCLNIKNIFIFRLQFL